MKIVNIYLFPKLTKLQFSGPQICQIGIWLITLKLRKWNLSYSECTRINYVSSLVVIFLQEGRHLMVNFISINPFSLQRNRGKFQLGRSAQKKPSESTYPLLAPL